MTYYVLTKRSAPSDGGKLTHQIYGCTVLIDAARAWFRASIVTDVVELYGDVSFGTYGDTVQTIIQDARVESWRETQLKQEKI